MVLKFTLRLYCLVIWLFERQHCANIYTLYTQTQTQMKTETDWKKKTLTPWGVKAELLLSVVRRGLFQNTTLSLWISPPLTFFPCSKLLMLLRSNSSRQSVCVSVCKCIFDQLRWQRPSRLCSDMFKLQFLHPPFSLSLSCQEVLIALIILQEFWLHFCNLWLSCTCDDFLLPSFYDLMF